MKPLSKDKKISIWYSKPLIILEIILIVLLFKGVWGVYAKYKRASNTMDNTQIEFNKVDDRYNKLQNKVDYLGTEFAQEEAMRERFDVIHPGEEVIKLVNKEVQVQEVEIVEKKGFWKKVISIFGF